MYMNAHTLAYFCLRCVLIFMMCDGTNTQNWHNTAEGEVFKCQRII